VEERRGRGRHEYRGQGEGGGRRNKRGEWGRTEILLMRQKKEWEKKERGGRTQA